MKYGAEGYALYWMCIELIAAPIDKHNLTFELEHDAEILAHRLHIDSAKVEEIMKYMVQLGLFEINPTTQVITCFKLANRLENSIIKNPYLKQVQKTLSGNNPDKSRTIPDNSGKVRPDIDIDTDIDINNNIRSKKFTPPTVDEVKTYCRERGNNVDPQQFVDFYSATNWIRGKTKIKDWKACVRTWEKSQQSKPKPTSDSQFIKWAESKGIRARAGESMDQYRLRAQREAERQ